MKDKLLLMLIALSLVFVAGVFVGCEDDDDGDKTTADDDDDDNNDDDSAPDPHCVPDAECAPEDACATGECIGGMCVEPVSSANYNFGDIWGLVSYVDMLEKSGAGDCCFDLDGDESIDNKFAALLSFLTGIAATGGTMLEVSQNIKASIDNGYDWHAFELVEETELACGPVKLAYWRVDSDLDGDGMPESTTEAVAEGTAKFKVKADSFGDYGSLFQFNRASIDEDTLYAVDGKIELPFYLVPDAEPLSIMVENARLESGVNIDGGNITTTSEMKVGGSVKMSIVMEQFDLLARGCTCVGDAVDRTKPIFTAEYVNDEMETLCAAGLKISDVFKDTCDLRVDGFICYYLGPICAGIKSIGTLADISSGVTDDNGEPIIDSLSFGAELVVNEATREP